MRATVPPLPDPQTALRNKDELPSPPHSSPLDAPAEALGCNHSGDSYRGDPMEPLEFPEAIPPRGENHYLGRYVAVFNEIGKLVEIIWVRYRRNLMFEFQ
jgi:hypothetical protein